MIDHHYYSEHWTDARGRPEGGVSTGMGFTISWQHGPLGRGTSRRDPNGAFVETIIAAAKDRIEFYQDGQFACEENAQAIAALDRALEYLNARTARREAEGIEGTHHGN